MFLKVRVFQRLLINHNDMLITTSFKYYFTHTVLSVCDAVLLCSYNASVFDRSQICLKQRESECSRFDLLRSVRKAISETVQNLMYFSR